MKFLKTGSLAVCTDESAYGIINRVGKVLAIVNRKNPYDQEETMMLFKIHYNGQCYIIPDHYLRKATAEEKTQDKRNPVYWKNMNQHINLAKITWERKTRTIYPY
tara:strand:- start:3339 stop:3653 length:315 start_codon:yes stop_codon:yes gene_type:complete